MASSRSESRHHVRAYPASILKPDDRTAGARSVMHARQTDRAFTAARTIILGKALRLLTSCKLLFRTAVLQHTQNLDIHLYRG